MKPVNIITDTGAVLHPRVPHGDLDQSCKPHPMFPRISFAMVDLMLEWGVLVPSDFAGQPDYPNREVSRVRP